jgi:hypothetical protein
MSYEFLKRNATFFLVGGSNFFLFLLKRSLRLVSKCSTYTNLIAHSELTKTDQTVLCKRHCNIDRDRLKTHLRLLQYRQSDFSYDGRLKIITDYRAEKAEGYFKDIVWHKEAIDQLVQQFRYKCHSLRPSSH